ncbi:MAG: hypothetical protein L0Y45_03175 [Woeseiaceae bacterium]|nr:hypothetical protein [Woeseiaceae bacterium]
MTTEPQRDRAITWILASIWFGAVLMVLITWDDAPIYLLAIGTLFFLMLVPSMKELVRNVEKRFSGKQNEEASIDDRDAHS